MARIFRTLRALAAAAVLLGTAACVAINDDGPSVRVATAESRATMNGRIFDQVWALVAERYYADPAGRDWARARTDYRPRAVAAADTESLYVVLTLMLERLEDAHAYVQSPLEVAREREPDGSRPLFGIRVRRHGESFVVDDVRPGGPADQAGVEAGWTLVSVDGRPYRIDIPRRIGTAGQVTFRDAEGRLRVISVAPQRVMFGPRRRAARLDSGVWLIGWDDFEPGVGEWLFETLRTVPTDAPLVLDLRDNVGGRIYEVERTLGCFIRPGGLVARMRPRTGEGRSSVVRTGCPHRRTGPLTVLVGRRSRSGAEMFAAAIQEWRRGEVVGERTAGALLSSLRHPLADGGRLTISEADFITAGGVRVERNGVRPDVSASRTQADRRAGRDPVLDVAVARLRRQAPAQTVSTPALELH